MFEEGKSRIRGKSKTEENEKLWSREWKKRRRVFSKEFFSLSIHKRVKKNISSRQGHLPSFSQKQSFISFLPSSPPLLLLFLFLPFRYSRVIIIKKKKNRLKKQEQEKA